MNNEVKVRRSIKSVVLEKAKIISYKNIEEARAKRAAKEEVAAGKGKRGRKRKSPSVEADASNRFLETDSRRLHNPLLYGSRRVDLRRIFSVMKQNL